MGTDTVNGMLQPTTALVSCFRVPCQLSTLQFTPSKVLVIGQCLLDIWPDIIKEVSPNTVLQRIVFNHLTVLTATPPLPPADYDMQIISLPLRSILPETEYMRMDVSVADVAFSVLERAKSRLDLQLQEALAWYRSSALSTIVCNLLVPQQNPMGRTVGRYDLRNLCFFVEELNRHIAETIAPMRGVHLLDIDSIAASIGKRYVQDDSICAFSHGGLIADFNFASDQRRIDPPLLTIEQTFEAKREQFVKEVWLEASAIWRTVRRIGAVKLVIMDLDDTIWRGVLAEETSLNTDAIEGWPLGVWDALSYLNKRGVILAIASKNEENHVTAIFEKLAGTRLPLDTFAIRKINWNSKILNVGEIIKEANVGVDATVFVDDSVVERAAVQAAYPGIRTIGADPYALKRILLWSSETQVEAITKESIARNATLAAAVNRSELKSRLTREEFLASLDTKVTFFDHSNMDDGRRERAFELLNKTNQFNTTGQRWERGEYEQALRDNALHIVCFEVADTLANYGLVGVVLVKGNEIYQAVMSCRVLGMDIEVGVLKKVTSYVFSNGASEVIGHLVHTDRNFPCRSWFATNGFKEEEGRWVLKKT